MCYKHFLSLRHSFPEFLNKMNALAVSQGLFPSIWDVICVFLFVFTMHMRLTLSVQFLVPLTCQQDLEGEWLALAHLMI